MVYPVLRSPRWRVTMFSDRAGRAVGDAETGIARRGAAS